ncbi:MAG: ROK family protein [Gammaproteobacteria bacterium]
MNILVVDIGGLSVKLALTGDTQPRSFPTPPHMTPQQLMQALDETAGDWHYERASIGFPGPIRANRPLREPVNLGTGWVDFDYAAAFGCPVRLINDAAMQALGSYRGGHMLFLGLGTGLGSAIIHDGHIVPLEMAHLPFRDGQTFEHALGKAGLDRTGLAGWKAQVLEAIALFRYALNPDYVVLGGGNVWKFRDDELPEQVFRGDNSNAFDGGFRLWEDNRASAAGAMPPTPAP